MDHDAHREETMRKLRVVTLLIAATACGQASAKPADILDAYKAASRGGVWTRFATLEADYDLSGPG